MSQNDSEDMTPEDQQMIMALVGLAREKQASNIIHLKRLAKLEFPDVAESELDRHLSFVAKTMNRYN
ncbi:hypothetical protein ACYPKM_02015 [Pseudomonas aeruginosa]